MPNKRHRLTHSNYLSPEAVHALLEKERLIKCGTPPEQVEDTHSEDLMSAASSCYAVFTWHVSDSAYFVRWLGRSCGADPFGDEASLKAIYAEFEEQELALANEGLAEFRQVMKEYDGE